MGLPTGSLLIAFVLVVMIMNLFIGSMSAKYALLAPVFLPMLLMAGISPEFTQAAYRVGDSTTNIITPLNPYIILILGTLRMCQPKAGLGSLIAVMLPYSIVFSAVWIALLLVWLALGLPLGPA
jgi:aminobenzoyl-glutamate transport protein